MASGAIPEGVACADRWKWSVISRASRGLCSIESTFTSRYRRCRIENYRSIARVSRVRRSVSGRKVAVKVFRPELAAALGTERFFREIKIKANLSHPHILPLLDSGEADGFLYYVMPLVEGESLRDRLNREKQLPVDEALKITSQVAGALSYAHSPDIVHRDIKPENILFQAGEVVVADFGIALAVDLAYLYWLRFEYVISDDSGSALPL